MRNHTERRSSFLGRHVFSSTSNAGHAAECGQRLRVRRRHRFDDYLRFIESSLPLISRYLKRVVPSASECRAFPAGNMTLDFDIRNHVHEAWLKHGTETELKALAGKTFGHSDGPAAAVVGY